MATTVANKVKYNIHNVYYAPLTIAADGTYTFATPIAMPGAKSISLKANGEPKSYYADGVEYYTVNNNQGYDGDLEITLVPESFDADVLCQTKDTNGVYTENSNSQTGNFALLFDFDGDQTSTHHVLYKCSASRPTIEGKTNEETKEVQPDKLTIKCRPLPDGVVKAKSGKDTPPTVSTAWFTAVYKAPTTAA